MKKYLGVLFILLIFMVGCGKTKNETSVTKPKGDLDMTIISKGYDWGPANYKLVVALDDSVNGDVEKQDFSVKGFKKVLNFETMEEEDLEDEVEITTAYVSDKSGIKTDSGKYIALELLVHPDSKLTSPYTFKLDTFQNVKDQVKYTVTLKKTLKLNKEVEAFTRETTDKTETVYEGIENFEEFDFKYTDEKFGEIELKYGLFVPEEKENKPLIILFHGAGEGGKDVSIALLGNKVVALAEEDIQSYFDDAYVLVPQTPDMWMNDGSGEYTTDGTSKYTNAVIEMIEQVLSENPEIDSNRVYVGGGSNGGFMTMNMILTKPDLFTAAFAICEAYSSDWVTDEQINKLKDFPIWFVHSTDDPTVPYETTAKALYDRMLASGHKNVHLSVYDGIFDNTGLYKDSEGKPYQYNGHWSWIPVFNDEVTDKDTKLFSWLASQTK